MRTVLAAAALLTLVCLQTTEAQNIDFSRCNEIYCHRSPAGCTQTTCTHGVTIETDDVKATITLTTNQGGMVALGFSDDRSMGQDDVVGCYRETGNNVVLVDAWNPGSTTANRNDAINNLDMASSIGSYDNGVLKCKVVRSLTTDDTSEDRDWKQLWYLFYPYSSSPGPGSGSSLPYHSATPIRSLDRINITAASSMATSAPTTQAPPPSTLVNIDFDRDGIFLYRDPVDCAPKDCKYGVTIETDGAKATIKLTTNEGGMVALGFSDDRAMGEDDVVGCVRTGGSAVAVKDSWNPGGRNPNVADTVNNLDTDNSFGTYVDSLLQCQIVRNLVSTDTTQDYDWTQLWYLLYPYSSGTGSADANRGLPQHSLTPSASEDLQNISAAGSGSAGATGVSIGFIKAHGILMIIAWIGLASTGMRLARFFKKVYPNDKPVCCFSGTPAAWFQLHRIHMISTLVFTIIGFIVIFSGVKGWTAGGGSGSRTAHPIIGTIVTALALAQPIMAVFRCNPEDKNRKIFNWAHYLVGTFALVLGVANVYIGVFIADDQFNRFLDRVPVYLLIVFSVFSFLFEMTLEIMTYMDRKKSSNSEIEMKGKGDSESPKSNDSDGGHFWKKVILFSHMAVSLGVTFACIVYIGVSNP